MSGSSRKIMAMIRDVNPRRQNVSIRVRVLVSWHQPPHGNIPETQEFVFMDEEAEKIHASIKLKFFDVFKELLSEGSTIMVDRFSVAANSSKYAVIPNRYKVLILNSTRISAITDFQGPETGLKFTSFQDIVSKKKKAETTVDIIGSIVSLGDVVEFEKNGSKSKRITVYLQDLESVSLRCTLFGVYAVQLEGLLADADSTRHAILVVQFAKINDYREQFSVTNAFGGTKVFLNADIAEITEFKQALLARPQGQPAFVLYNVANSQTAYSSPDDFFIGCEPIALSDITDHHKEAWYVTLATIDSIHQEERWWYSACRKCYKGVVPMSERELKECPDPGNGLKCGGCGPNPASMYPRYKVHVRVLNDTGSASFTLFDRHVQRMVAVSASDLRKKMVDGDDVFPEELNVLIGKKLLFKVEVSRYNIRENYQYYTVSACTDDASIIVKYKNMFELDTETMSDAHIQALENEDVAVPLANITAKDAVSGTADNEEKKWLTSSTAESPPAKRHDNQVDDEPLSVKSEYNKAKKRLVQVKVEKP